ncbi:MAG: hypothetical protein Rubg2KO_19680 [Rubricoccaceae bacterium]
MPRGSIQAQSVYPVLDVTQWTLANGVVVVYKQVPEAEGYVLRAVAKGGWSSLSPRDSADATRRLPRRWEADGLTAMLTAHERRIDAQGQDLEALLSSMSRVFAGAVPPARAPLTAVEALDPVVGFAANDASDAVSLDALFADPGAFTVVVVGAGESERAASAAGRHLAPLQSRQGMTFSPRSLVTSSPIRLDGTGEQGVVDLALRIPARAGDEGPLQVLRGALEASLQHADGGRLTVEAERTPWTGTAWLRVVVEDSPLSADALEAAVREALSGDALTISRARRQLLRDLRSPTPQHWLEAVTQLYRDGGGRQPGRDPSSLSPLRAPLTRVTDSDVLTLARRFAVSEDMAMILAP